MGRGCTFLNIEFEVIRPVLSESVCLQLAKDIGEIMVLLWDFAEVHWSRISIIGDGCS